MRRFCTSGNLPTPLPLKHKCLGCVCAQGNLGFRIIRWHMRTRFAAYKMATYKGFSEGANAPGTPKWNLAQVIYERNRSTSPSFGAWVSGWESISQVVNLKTRSRNIRVNLHMSIAKELLLGTIAYHKVISCICAVLVTKICRTSEYEQQIAHAYDCTHTQPEITGGTCCVLYTLINYPLRLVVLQEVVGQLNSQRPQFRTCKQRAV